MEADPDGGRSLGIASRRKGKEQHQIANNELSLQRRKGIRRKLTRQNGNELDANAPKLGGRYPWFERSRREEEGVVEVLKNQKVSSN